MISVQVEVNSGAYFLKTEQLEVNTDLSVNFLNSNLIEVAPTIILNILIKYK